MNTELDIEQKLEEISVRSQKMHEIFDKMRANNEAKDECLRNVFAIVEELRDYIKD